MKSIVVLYHADCPDGFGAAWAAWKKFGDRAEYHGISHGMPTIPGLRGKEIYLLDITYSAKDLARLRKENKRIMVIDHHESAKDVVTSQPEHVYDVAHSGAYLAWKYFHPNKLIPKFILHLQDVDLYQWKLPRTIEIFCALGFEEFEFKKWDRFAKDLNNAKKLKAIIKTGKIIEKNERHLIERIIRFNAEPVRFLGKKIYVVNSPVFESEIPHKLIKKYPPMAIVWRVRNGMKTFSIRSNASVNAAKIAAKFGGGGHPRSAGFTLPLNTPFPWTWLNRQNPNKGT